MQAGDGVPGAPDRRTLGPPRRGASGSREVAPVLESAVGKREGPLSLLQFRKGHSNLTYLVRYGDEEAVLRRAPFGVKVKTAHDMRREFTILSALQGLYDKAPRPIAFCDDESVAGAKFYLMER